MSEQAGGVIGGRYRVVETLGKGAMGVVYRAHDPVLDRMVAVKRMTAEIAHDPSLRQRFYVEARAAARLNHRNIVTVYELGETDQDIFIVMELVEGMALSQMIKQGAELPVTSIIDLMAQVCDGLDFAHLNGIIHRDIKPANLNVLPSGVVKILDFGIARLGSVHMTASGILIGTPDYMAPEQARGEDIDGRADLFSVGAVIYELVSSIKPFAGGTLGTVITRLIREPHVPLRERVPSTPAALSELVDRLLAKDRQARPATAGAVRDQLQAIGEALRGPTTKSAGWDDDSALEPTLVGMASPVAGRTASSTGETAVPSARQEAAADATSAPGASSTPGGGEPSAPESAPPSGPPEPEAPIPPVPAPASQTPAAPAAPPPTSAVRPSSAAGPVPSPSSEPSERPATRGRWGLPVAAILLLGIAAGAYFWWQGRAPASGAPETVSAGETSGAAPRAGSSGAAPQLPPAAEVAGTAASGGAAAVPSAVSDSPGTARPDAPPASPVAAGSRPSIPRQTDAAGGTAPGQGPTVAGGGAIKPVVPPAQRAEFRQPDARPADARPAPEPSPRARAELTGDTLDAFSRPGGGDVASLARSAALVAAENRIRYVIGRYADAFEAGDAEALSAVRPSPTPSESAWIAAAAKVVVRIDSLDVRATETEGVVRCRRMVEGQLASGAPVNETRTVTIRLVRRPTGWIIVDLR